MTIEEAATTLGLAPHEVAPELVERTYRLKALHCHPDRASYPGAAAEFKRATAAFNYLKQTVSCAESTNSEVDPEFEEAVENFTFGVLLRYSECWLRMGWSAWLDRFAGTHQFRLQTAGKVQQGDPLAMFTHEANSEHRKLAVVPVDAEVSWYRSHQMAHYWCLRPLETDQVRRRLERYLDSGHDLSRAVEHLATELSTSARIPLSV